MYVVYIVYSFQFFHFGESYYQIIYSDWVRWCLHIITPIK